MGYSLSTTPHAICNFLSIEDIAGAEPEVYEGIGNAPQDTERSFVVKVHAHGSPGNIGESVHSPGEISKDKTLPLSPKPYYFKASSITERDQWIEDINSALIGFHRKREAGGVLRIGSWRRFQRRLQSIYTSAPFQTATAITVGLNFFVTVSAGGADGDTRTLPGCSAVQEYRLQRSCR